MKMMALSGEIAEGVLFNYLVSPAITLKRWNTCIGAEEAGRKLDDIDRPQLIVCSLDRERGARSTMRGSR